MVLKEVLSVVSFALRLGMNAYRAWSDEKYPTSKSNPSSITAHKILFDIRAKFPSHDHPRQGYYAHLQRDLPRKLVPFPY